MSKLRNFYTFQQHTHIPKRYTKKASLITYFHREMQLNSQWSVASPLWEKRSHGSVARMWRKEPPIN